MDSGAMPLDAVRTISAVDFQRLEKKMDRLGEAVGKLIIVEERQSNQSIAIAEIRANHEKDKIELQKDIEANAKAIAVTEKKVDQWINRGIGVWAVALVLFALLEAYYKHGA